MDRTEYFNDTKPSQTQLNNTEDTKINHILTRGRTQGEFGVVQGLEVSVNGGDNTKIDIDVGEAYTGGHFTNENLKGSPNAGEYIKVDVKITGKALADYTLNAKNYVILTYSETSSIPLTTRDAMATYDTIYTGTYAASVITEAAWNGYSPSEKEQRVLVAIVTGNGAGSPPAALYPTNITQCTQPHRHPYTNQPSNITGVTIVQASSTTAIGDGTLRWTYAAINTLEWMGPADMGYGTAVNVTSSGTYTVYSAGGLSYLIITVEYGLISTSSQTDTITVSDMYGRTIPLASAVDQAHRDMFGSGKISPNNPHGISWNDITSGTFDHADLFHRNGIGIQSDVDNLECSVSSTDIKIINNGGFSNSFVIDGTTHEYITGYPGGAQPLLHFVVSPAPLGGWYMIYLDEGANPNYVLMADYNPAGGETSPLGKAPNPLTNIQIVDMANYTAGTGTVDWNDTTKLLKYASPQDSAGPNYGASVYIDETIVADNYYKLYSNTTTDWIIVHVIGSLGGASSNQTFTVDMNNSDQADELILRLGSVLWNDDTKSLHDLVDIRQKLTADNMGVFMEEHDLNGHHAVPLKDTLKVYAYNKSCGIVGIGANVGVKGIGYGVNDWGVYGSGSHIGVEGRCDIANGTGIHGYGEADTIIGVLGQVIGATCTGVYGRVVGDTAIAGAYEVNGESGTGIYVTIDGSKPVAMYVTASAALSALGIKGLIRGESATAMYAAASGTSAIGLKIAGEGVSVTGISMSGVYGIICDATTYGMSAFVETTGIHMTAGVVGVDITAGSIGINAVAPNTGLKISVASNISSVWLDYSGLEFYSASSYAPTGFNGIRGWIPAKINGRIVAIPYYYTTA